MTSHSALTGMDTHGVISTGSFPLEESAYFGSVDDDKSGVCEILDADSEDEFSCSKARRESSKEASPRSSRGSDDNSSDGTTTSSGSFSSDHSCTSSDGYEDDDTFEDIPECGTLVNVKPKIGERVSRVHPDHTSHLLRSRFRRKYFPRAGTFPYDK
jgi:hypothetical protein